MSFITPLGNTEILHVESSPQTDKPQYKTQQQPKDTQEPQGMFGPKILRPTSLKIKSPLGRDPRFIASQLRFSSLASNTDRYSKASNMTRSSLPEGAPSASVDGFLSNGNHETPMSNQPQISEMEFLIAGAGPAGASLACFLTSYGIFHDHHSIISNKAN
jgi:hypothetical protein